MMTPLHSKDEVTLFHSVAFKITVGNTVILNVACINVLKVD